MKKRGHKLQILLALAFSSELLYVIIASYADLRFHIPIYLLCYGGIFLFYWIAAVAFFDMQPHRLVGKLEQQIKKYPRISRSKWLNNYFIRQKIATKLTSKEVLTIGIFFGVIFRLTLLITTPSLSDDIYRYVWDGKVALNGINPYLYPPNDEALSSLRDDEIYPKVNHPEISTIYPPMSQIVFLVLARIKPTVMGFKTAILLLDLLTAWVLFLIIKRLSLNWNRMLLYFWNPLVIVEFSGNGHADVFGILLLAAALYFVVRGRTLWANFYLVLSFLTKFISVILLPIFALLKNEFKSMVLFLFVILAAAFYLPYSDAGERLVTGLVVYSAKWQFNASIFTVILAAVKAWLPQEWIVKWMITPYGYGVDPATIDSRGTDLALMISKVFILLIFSGIFIYFLARFKRDFKREGNIWVFKFGLISFGAFFLLNPTAQPWYLCWLLPFLVVAPNRAGFLLTGLVGISYWTLNDFTRTGVWQESNWVQLVEYLPFYLLLIFDYVMSKLKPRMSSLREKQMFKSKPGNA
ncbi:MAG: hypothetical protein ACE5HS_05785 [bacterium]